VKARFSPVPLVAALLIFTAGCSWFQQKAVDKNIKAMNSTKQSVTAYLTELEKIAPEQSGAVHGCLDLWDTRSEDQNLTLAKPLLLDYARLRPNEAPAVNALLQTWQERVDKMKVPPA
jgi:hypothetical protein